MNTSSGKFAARCFCGEVEYEATGEPVFVGYGHCTDCRGWLGAPVHAATLWPSDNVRLVKGADKVLSYARTGKSHRKSCKTCGGHVANDHPGMMMTDLLASVMPDYEFRPTMHIFYGERMIAMKDGLPKYESMPEAFGGDGKMLPE